MDEADSGVVLHQTILPERSVEVELVRSAIVSRISEK